MSEIAHTLSNGRYRIERLLGTGGMSVVLLAMDTRLGVERAIKLLNPRFARSRELRARFQNEAFAQAGLRHPNILMVHDVIEDETGFYMVMELADRGSLSSRVREHGPLSPRETALIGATVARALAVAHEANVIHRDIKPDNILVDRRGNLKLADFGIARVVQRESNLTQTGVVIGTLNYMPPEQLEDTSGVDHRADIYALGGTLYFLLTARHPSALHNRETHAAAFQHIPPPLARVIQRATRFSPDDRYPSGLDMAADLEALADFLDDEPLFTYQPSGEPRPKPTLEEILPSYLNLALDGPSQTLHPATDYGPTTGAIRQLETAAHTLPPTLFEDSSETELEGVAPGPAAGTAAAGSAAAGSAAAGSAAAGSAAAGSAAGRAAEGTAAAAGTAAAGTAAGSAAAGVAAGSTTAAPSAAAASAAGSTADSPSARRRIYTAAGAAFALVLLLGFLGIQSLGGRTDDSAVTDGTAAGAGADDAAADGADDAAVDGADDAAADGADDAAVDGADGAAADGADGAAVDGAAADGAAADEAGGDAATAAGSAASDSAPPAAASPTAAGGAASSPDVAGGAALEADAAQAGGRRVITVLSAGTDEAADAAADLRPRVPSGVVVLRTIPSGATVSERGKVLSPGASGSYELPAGSHVLDVRSTNGERTQLPVVVAAGQTVEICYSFDTNSACAE